MISGYAMIVKYKCKFPIPKMFCPKCGLIEENICFNIPHHQERKICKPKSYYLRNKINHFLKLKGLNFDVILVEGVISVDNTLNEFVDYKKNIKYLFIPRIIDNIASEKTKSVYKNQK